MRATEWPPEDQQTSRLADLYHRGPQYEPVMIVRCVVCSTTFPERTPLAVCSACGGMLTVEHAHPAESGAALRARFDERLRAARIGGLPHEQSGVWRFHEIMHPTALSDAVSQPEGNTPLISRPAIARY